MNKKILAFLGATLFFVTSISFVAQASVFNSTDGTVTVMASGGTAYSDQNNSVVHLTSSGGTVASVDVPAGRYFLEAKSWSDLTIGGHGSFVQCGFISGNADNDSSRSTTPTGTLIAQGVDEFASPATITYECASDGNVDIYTPVLTITTLSAFDLQ